MFKNNQKINIENRSGFTLVETIMYVAFIATTISLFVGFGSQLHGLRAKTAVFLDVEANGATTINFLEDYLKKSRQVLAPLPGAPIANVLTLDMPDSADDATFSLVDGVLFLTENMASPVQITSSAINIKELTFANTAMTGQKDNIVINLDMEYRYHGSSAYEYNTKYQTTVTLR